MDALVVEDDAVLGKSLQKGLTESRHRCVWTRSGSRGLELARSQQFDVIILDLLLPDLPGLDLLRTLRSEGNRTPVLALTALGSVDDRVIGLKAGADDYLVKPFAFVELTARLEALTRRSAVRPALSIEVGPLSLDMGNRRVTRDGTDIDLSPTEFSVLELLMRHAGQVVTRKMLNERIWQDDWTGANNVIEVYINHLRKKVDRPFGDSLIHTVRSRGYVLRSP